MTERFTISLDADLARQFDAFIHAHAYSNRSEAVRDMLRAQLESDRLEEDTGHCVGSLSYVYNHHERELAERVTGHQHDHHDLVVSSMHVHLDHDNCMETVVLRGPTVAVRQLADQLCAERGVRHGALNLVPVEVNSPVRHHHHDHDDAAGTPHVHMRPRT